MKIQKTKIDGVYVIELSPRQDDRGYFSRVFCKNELKQAGIEFEIAQINRSLTLQKGTVRGMHYQKKPKQEDKIVQCLGGSIFDVALDIRPKSKTFGEWVGVELTAENKKMLLIPKGCAHGFQTLEKDCLVEYFVSEFYSPEFEHGIRWNDSQFRIVWPFKKAIVSEKDSRWPDFEK